jgi:Spy/CpxP family protein refolding chaperone
MKNIRSIGRILVMVAAGATAGVALAQGPAYGPGPGSGPGFGPGMGPGMMGGPGGPGMGPGMTGRHHGGPGMGPGMMQGRGEFMARALGLSEDQRAKIRGIFEETRRKNWGTIGQIQSERFALQELMRGDKVDPGAAVEQKRKIDDLKRQVMRVRLEARNQVLAVLTPEQQEKARALRQQRGGRGLG